jgi:hypothetical protein
VKTALRSLALAALSALVLVSAACGDDEGGGEGAGSATTTTAPEATEDVTLTAQLSGKEEVPDPGVADGTGVAEVIIKGNELCYKLAATMAETPTAAHVHTGKAGVAGDVLVDLMPEFTKAEGGFAAEKCVTPDAAAIASIQGDPTGFYVNIHSAEHPKGAMRGQLAGAPG